MADSPRPPSPGPVEVAAALISDGDSILICQRSFAGSHPGKFEFPGGKREGGESLQECLRREIEEELSVESEIGPELWRTDFQYEGRSPVRLVFFAIAGLRGAMVNRVFAAVHWVAWQALGEYDFLAADRPLVDAIATGAIVVPPTRLDLTVTGGEIMERRR